MQMLVCLVLSQGTRAILNFYFHSFFLYSILQQWFRHSVFQAAYLLSCLSYSALGFSQGTAPLCLCFSSSRSLVNTSCIFPFPFPRTWVICTVIILNYFSARLPICTSFSYFPGVSSCSFIREIILPRFVLIDSLWLWLCSGGCRTDWSLLLHALWWMRLMGGGKT